MLTLVSPKQLGLVLTLVSPKQLGLALTLVSLGLALTFKQLGLALMVVSPKQLGLALTLVSPKHLTRCKNLDGQHASMGGDLGVHGACASPVDTVLSEP